MCDNNVLILDSQRGSENRASIQLYVSHPPWVVSSTSLRKALLVRVLSEDIQQLTEADLGQRVWVVH